MTLEQTRQKIIDYALKHGLKIPSIGSEKYPNPFPVGGRTIKKIYYGLHVSKGSLSILELFFNSLQDD